MSHASHGLYKKLKRRGLHCYKMKEDFPPGCEPHFAKTDLNKTCNGGEQFGNCCRKTQHEGTVLFADGWQEIDIPNIPYSRGVQPWEL